MYNCHFYRSLRGHGKENETKLDIFNTYSSYSDSTGSSAKTQDYMSEMDRSEKAFAFEYHSEQAIKTQERHLEMLKKQKEREVGCWPSV